MDSCRGEDVNGFLLAARSASDESVILQSENPTPIVPLSMPVVEPLKPSNLNACSEVSRTTIGEKAVTRTFVRDGGGVVSSADWQQARCTLPACNDPFATLRRELLSSVLTKDVVGRFKARALNPSKEEFFSSSEITALRQKVQGWLETRLGHPVPDTVAEGQPFALHIMRGVALVMKDIDVSLIDSLEAGVKTGVLDEVPASGVWRTVENLEAVDVDLVLNESNWASADSKPEVTQRLVDAELKEGFIFEVESLQKAKELFGDRLAIGKLGVVSVAGKDDRLVCDSTASGCNPRVRFAERAEVPQISDLGECFDRAGAAAPEWTLFILDVKAAHKRVRLHPSEYGLNLFWSGGRLFGYRVAHFGGTWAAYWWGRTGALLLRMVHQILCLPHAGLIYVDDLLLAFRKTVGVPMALLTIALLVAVGVPLSWNKMKFGPECSWIGFELDLRKEFRISFPSGSRPDWSHVWSLCVGAAIGSPGSSWKRTSGSSVGQQTPSRCRGRFCIVFTSYCVLRRRS